MDARFYRNMTITLNIIVVLSTFALLLHTSKLSAGLILLSALYNVIVFLRDRVLKIDLTGSSGMLFLYAQVIIALAVCIWSESFFAQTYLLVLIAEFTFHQSRRHALAFTFITYCSVVMGVLVYRQFPSFEYIYLLIPRFIEFFAIFGISMFAKIVFEQKIELAAAYKQLEIASVGLEEKAVLRERNRISREIHDAVGHTIVSSLTGLQTASRAIEKGNYPLVKQMLDRTADNLHKGLEDVRSSVHLLREHSPENKFLPELKQFIEQLQQQASVEITCRFDPAIPKLPPAVELTLLRALQEGLTNGIRHGGSRLFQFSLLYQDHRLQFILTDHGRAPASIKPGFGLTSMKERVEEVGGHLTVSSGTEQRGVTIEITIPLEAATRTGGSTSSD